MINFRLDSEKKLIQVEMMLKGEAETIKFQIGKYELFREDEKLFIEISDMSTNREWMNTAIANFLPNRKIEIPSEYEKMLKIVL